MAKTCQAVSCDSASLRSCLAGLSTREASAEVGQLLRCRRVRAATDVRALAVARTDPNGLSRYLWPPFWWSHVPAKAVRGGDRSNIWPSQGWIFDWSWPGAFDRWQNLTGHIAYRIFDRLPVKYPVPLTKYAKLRTFDKLFSLNNRAYVN